MFYARLAHSSCKSLALTRDLMAPATLLPLTTFLQHTASSVTGSPSTHPQVFKFWHMLQLHPIYTNLFSHTPQQNLSPLPSGLLLTRHTESSHLHTRYKVISISPLLPIPIFPLHHFIHIYTEEVKGHYATLSHTSIDPEPLTLNPFYTETG